MHPLNGPGNPPTLKPFSYVLWFTGLSGAGKSTVVRLLEGKLNDLAYRTSRLDGDDLRRGLCADLGFSDTDRAENLRRAAEVATLLADTGLIVLAAFISPFQKDRNLVKAIVGEHRYCEIYVSTPLGVVERRDPKGLYRQARLGQIENFTGIDSPYEIPESPALSLDTTGESPERSADRVLQFLMQRGVIGGVSQ